MSQRRQANFIEDQNQKQYHIACEKGDLEPYILLVGDPARVEKISARFDTVRVRRSHREFVTATGIYRGIPLTVMGTGIGHDNTEIAMIEACQLVEKPTFIRCGTCSTLQADVPIGSLAITQASLRLENTTQAYVPIEYPAVAHPDIMIALAKSCRNRKTSFSLGLTASTSGFYAPQGRSAPGFPARNPDLAQELGKVGVLNFEMETASVLVFAQLKKARAGAICAVIGNRATDVFADAALMQTTEEACIEATLGAFVELKLMDELGQSPVWTGTHAK